jgi:hypothetical protein
LLHRCRPKRLPLGYFTFLKYPSPQLPVNPENEKTLSLCSKKKLKPHPIFYTPLTATAATAAALPAQNGALLAAFNTYCARRLQQL